MQSEVTKQRNETGTTPDIGQGQTTQTTQASNLAPGEQSQLDRESNFEQQANKVADKLATDPSSVSKEDANTM